MIFHQEQACKVLPHEHQSSLDDKINYFEFSKYFQVLAKAYASVQCLG